MNHTQSHEYDSSYTNSMPLLSDESTAYSPSLSYPAKALNINLPAHLTLQPPSELTPPPSHARSVTFDALNSASKMLNRASSAITRRPSVMSASPTRQSETASTTSSRRASPTRASRVSNAAAAFAGLFEGSSELVNSFSVSSKKQYDLYMNRPGHSRTNTARSRLGRSSAREDEIHSPEDDEILNLDIDAELFAGWSDTDDSIAVDDIVGNAKRLFLRMQMAYEARLEAVNREVSLRQQLQDDLENERTRNEHMRRQMKDLSDDLDEEQQANTKLSRELEGERRKRKQEQATRTRSIRHVNASPVRESMYGLTAAARDDDSTDESDYWSGPHTPSSFSSPSTSGEYALGYGFLRQENQILKARVAELEETVESCLAFLPPGL